MAGVLCPLAGGFHSTEWRRPRNIRAFYFGDWRVVGFPNLAYVQIARPRLNYRPIISEIGFVNII